jgi:lipoprotein NlpI
VTGWIVQELTMIAVHRQAGLRAMSSWILLAFVLGVLAFEPKTKAADAVNIEALLNEAQAAELKGDHSAALALANRALDANPNHPQTYYVRGRLFAAARDHARAVEDFDRALKIEPRAAEVYQLRGVEQFKLGHFQESVADFDKVIQFIPKQAPLHWQRGISCYYAGLYEEGRKQFELHQTVNSNDVENAVWHFLCVARSAGLDKARASLIKIKDDLRLPMMKIHALFGGNAKPEDVLAAARSGYTSTAQLNRQLFYAHLYLGLYYEAVGDEKQTREHIFKAAEDASEDDYMGAVARVHAELLRRNKRP